MGAFEYVLYTSFMYDLCLATAANKQDYEQDDNPAAAGASEPAESAEPAEPAAAIAAVVAARASMHSVCPPSF